MSTPQGILILADEPVGSELSAQLGGVAGTRHGDPYDVLMAVGSGGWGSIVVTAPRPDFPGLCRAIRRLQSSARVFAVCEPAAEPEVRPLVGETLTDYFIYPPTRGELRRLRQGGPEGEESPEPADATRERPQISVEEMARLLDATTSPGSLGEAIADLVTRCLGRQARWVLPDQSPSGRTLLVAPDVQHRALVVEGHLDDEALDGIGGLLVALKAHLPALAAAAERTETLHRLAVTDHLTGAYNRRYFYHLTDQILARAGKRNLRVSLLLFDIDDFKHYNDTYGHATGDKILCEIASLMKGVVRSHDIVARIGGDEFAILFWDVEQPRNPGSDPPETAQVLSERFLQAVDAHRFPSLGPAATGHLTISGGLAGFPGQGTTCRELLARADEALRGSKTGGKNTISLIGEEA